MPKKPRERYKDKLKAKEAVAAEARPAMTVEELKRRRYRRLMFVALIGLSFPVLEFIAYQFRAITITVTNRTDVMVKKVKVTYDGGAFETTDIKPGNTFTKSIRPNYRFTNDHFSTYTFAINVSVEDGSIVSIMGRSGTIDYSAQEIYNVQAVPPEGHVQLQHTTRPGFPLGFIRDLMQRLGLG